MKVYRRTRRSARPIMESLEGRQLLSGDLTASVAGGHLVLLGDAEANEVVLTAGANAGEVVITSGASATTINGEDGPATLTGVTRGIVGWLRAGDDSLRISGLTVRGNIRLDAGAGADAITLDGDTSVAGHLRVLGGLGDDTITLDALEVASNVALGNIAGNDTFNANQVDIGGVLQVRGGAGDDEVSLTDSEIRRTVVIHGADLSLNGCDLGGALVVVTGLLDGDVEIIDSTIAKPTILVTRAGADSITLAGSTFGHTFVAVTGLGADTVTIEECVFQGHFVLNTGLGDDVVNIQAEVVLEGAGTRFRRNAVIRTGAGDDELTIGPAEQPAAAAIFDRIVHLHGGAGDDTLNHEDRGNEFTIAPVILSFENA